MVKKKKEENIKNEALMKAEEQSRIDEHEANVAANAAPAAPVRDNSNVNRAPPAAPETSPMVSSEDTPSKKGKKNAKANKKAAAAAPAPSALAGLDEAEDDDVVFK